MNLSRRIIIDGNKSENWRDDMDACGIYIALITENFCEDMKCLEQVFHAKDSQIPTIQLWKEGVELPIPDLFKEVNVVATLYFNEDNKYDIKNKLANKVKELQEGKRITLHRANRDT